MKNFPIIDKETGREYWISRSVAVVIFVYAYDAFGREYILAVQRGTGTPDPEYVGKWCLPCGYLDFDETVEEAAVREIFEETGLRLKPDWMDFLNINSDPKSDKRQNVTIRYEYVCDLYVDDLEHVLSSKNSEKNEVSGIKFIPTDDIDSYEWAFNHKELIIANKV